MPGCLAPVVVPSRHPPETQLDPEYSPFTEGTRGSGEPGGEPVVSLDVGLEDEVRYKVVDRRERQ